MPPENEYLKALREARMAAFSNTEVTVSELQRVYLESSEQLLKVAESGTNAISRERAETLRREVLDVMGELEDRVSRGTAGAMSMTVDDVARMHRSALVSLEDEVGQGVKLASRLGSLNSDAMAMAMLGQGSPVNAFKTLTRRHMKSAAPVVDMAINQALLTGTSSKQLTESLARTLVGHPELLPSANGRLRKMSLDQLRQLGIGPSTNSGLRSLYYDSKRIAVSSINNGLRETNALGLSRSPVVAGAQWWLSGRHHEEDACDILATQDLYGLGPGYYPGEYWPMAPHPFCACYQGRVKARPPSEWNTEYEPPDRIRNPMENPRWAQLAKKNTVKKVRRMQVQVLDAVETAEDRFFAIAAPRPETIEKIKKILRMTDEGKTPKEIGAIMGLTAKRVRALRRQGEREGIKYDAKKPAATTVKKTQTVDVEVPTLKRKPGKLYFEADQEFVDDMKQWLLLKHEGRATGQFDFKPTANQQREIFKGGKLIHLRAFDIESKLSIYSSPPYDTKDWPALTAFKQSLERRLEWIRKLENGTLDADRYNGILKEMEWIEFELQKHTGSASAMPKMSDRGEVALLKVFHTNLLRERADVLRAGRAAGINIGGEDILPSGTQVNMNKLKSVSATIELDENVRINKARPKKAVAEGVADFNALVNKKYETNLKDVQIKRTKSGRAYYQSNDWDDVVGAHSSVNIGDWDASHTVVHELGHHLENRVYEIKQAAQDFYFTRTAGEAPVSLKHLTGANYDAAEMARPDAFFDPYVGKAYNARTVSRTYRAGEIVSMGLEAMAKDPLKFLEDDPEHFALIWGIITGEL